MGAATAMLGLLVVGGGFAALMIGLYIRQDCQSLSGAVGQLFLANVQQRCQLGETALGLALPLMSLGALLAVVGIAFGFFEGLWRTLGKWDADAAAKRTRRSPAAPQSKKPDEYVPVLIVGEDTGVHVVKVPALKDRTVVLQMPRPGRLSGYVVISGGNDDIKLEIRSPTGQKVVEVQRAQARHDFACPPGEDGPYSVKLDNFFSAVTDKQVTLVYSLS